jgi:ubiquinone/menaquinone biosynthesis C-methylase UbiE
MQTTSVDDARFWDRIARKYARDPIADMSGYERTVERTRHLLRPTDTVIEFGCGTGTTALLLAPHVKHLIATDISNEMITICREKAAAQGVNNLELMAVSAEDAARQGRPVDAALAFSFLHLASDRARIFQHIFQMLKPGGYFISKTPCLSEMNPLLRVAIPPMRWIGKAPRVAFFSARALVTDIEAQGFTVVEQGRHGSKRKDPRIFIVAQKPSDAAQG